MRASAAAALALALAGCPSSSGTPDSQFDDNGRCPGELFLTGEYVDWDSTDANFHGVAFATFALDASHMDQTSPNGRVEMCIPKSGRSLVAVTSMSGDDHLAGHFIADPAVFGGGAFFSLRGITPARAASFFTAQGATYDAGKADLLVNEVGTPVTLSLGGANAAAVWSSPDGVTWATGASGKYVLFANVTVTGSPTLSGPSTGAGAVPMLPGEWTMTAVGQ